MLIGYVRVSKSDGSQTLAPQRDAMLSAGVEPDRIYQDLASGRHDARPGLSACLKALQPGNTLDTTTANGRQAFGITMRIQRPSTRSAFTALNDCEPPELLGSIKQQLRDRS